jgi:alanine racemase
MTPDLLSKLRPARATIDLSRLAANYRAVAASVPVPLMPVIKADAYGHGAAYVARALVAQGATLLAVAYVEEAVALRQAGIATEIVVLSGFGSEQLDAIVAHDLVPVIGSPATLQLVVGRPAEAPRVRVHLKLDTGMTRLGLMMDEAYAAARALTACASADLVGILTHLASADEDEGVTQRQLDQFDDFVARLAARGIRPRYVHAANSAGLAFLRPTHTLARPGLLLYGLRPQPLSPAVEVRPVMTLSAEIAALKDVAAGVAVSYGGRWTAARPSRIAILPIGYADGLPRTTAMRQQGRAMVRGARARVAGTVCMDLMMLDVTDVPSVSLGDSVVLMGDEPTAWDLASWSDGNAWESLTRVGSRVPRVYVEEGRIVAVESRYRY